MTEAAAALDTLTPAAAGASAVMPPALLPVVRGADPVLPPRRGGRADAAVTSPTVELTSDPLPAVSDPRSETAVSEAHQVAQERLESVRTSEMLPSAGSGAC